MSQTDMMDALARHLPVLLSTTVSKGTCHSAHVAVLALARQRAATMSSSTWTVEDQSAAAIAALRNASTVSGI